MKPHDLVPLTNWCELPPEAMAAEAVACLERMKKRHMRSAMFAATSALLLCADVSVAQQPVRIRAPLVDNYTLHFNVPPEVLWAELKAMYVKGDKFTAQGFTVKPLDDPGAILGGTRIVRTLPNGKVEERVARFTRIDDGERFLALQVSYSEGIVGNVSYQARPAGRGSDFQLIAHMEQDIVLNARESASREAIADKVEAVLQGHHRELAQYWEGEKARMEAAR